MNKTKMIKTKKAPINNKVKIKAFKALKSVKKELKTQKIIKHVKWINNKIY